MADIDTSSKGGHKKGPGVKKGKKLSTRVDLTPMVDLGFLLITFFVFTTSMSAPTAMFLPLPKDVDKKEQVKIKQTGALTIMLGKDNNVFYYEGELTPNADNFKSANFGSGDDGIRAEILRKKATTNDSDFFVVIKPTEECTYKNVVNILDEMIINTVKKYALVDIAPVEFDLIKRAEGEPVTAASPAKK
jgi:biopolymer transport protein ExbD